MNKILKQQNQHITVKNKILFLITTYDYQTLNNENVLNELSTVYTNSFNTRVETFRNIFLELNNQLFSTVLAKTKIAQKNRLKIYFANDFIIINKDKIYNQEVLITCKLFSILFKELVIICDNSFENEIQIKNNCLYNINFSDQTEIIKKIESQKIFAKTNSTKKMKESKITYYDVSISANINSKRYTAELLNRSYSIIDFALEKSLVPIFITITSPSKFHDVIENKIVDDIYMEQNKYLLYSPKSAAKYLSNFWHKFMNLKAVKRIEKEMNQSFPYLRTFEPTKKGVPHIHSLFFLPKQHLKTFVKLLTNYCNKNEIKQKRIVYKKFQDGTKKDIKYALAYILKYTLKSFSKDNSKELNDDEQKLISWYKKNNIRRFATSRTLYPITKYRKLNVCKKDLLFLSKNKNNIIESNSGDFLEVYNENLDEFELIFVNKNKEINKENLENIDLFVNHEKKRKNEIDFSTISFNKFIQEETKEKINAKKVFTPNDFKILKERINESN